jgi:chorismate mutase
MGDTNLTLQPTIEQMEDYRASIDNLDTALIAILAERFRLTEKIGRTKALAGFEPMDPERERRQLERFRTLSSVHNLDVNVALDLMTRIIQHVKDRHEVLQRSSSASASTSTA